MLELDHVIVAVRDLDAAAARYEQRYGLSSVEGGRHRGFGTGNRIVPLGPSYLELMAVVDEEEAAGSALAAWVRRTCERGDRLGALCLRTDDIQGVAARLGKPALAMSRRRPDGVELRWELAGLDDMLAEPALPFFIQWHVDPADFPGAATVRHRADPQGLSWVEIAHDERALRERVGDPTVDIRVVPGTGGLRRAGVATYGGELIVE